MNRSAVIFDLDGTLTKPYLNFDLIRAEIGITSGPILEAVYAMSPSERARAETILMRHEWEAAHNCELHEGAVEIVAQFRRKGHPVALLTRNTRPVVEHILDMHGFRFDAIRTREDGAIKPSAEPVFSLCEELGAGLAQSWVVGDYLFDLQSGRSAGTRTVLMIGDDKLPSFASLADHVIRRLLELPAIIVDRDLQEQV